MKNVKIYTFKTCPFCIKAKMILDAHNIKYEEEIITMQELNELEKKTGQGTVPQIFFDEELMGGCDDIVKLANDGLLEKEVGL